MKRQTWEFEFGIGDLVNAATERAEHHRDREKFWADEGARAEAEIQASARVELMPVSGGNRAELRADPAILRRHEEARSKASEHRRSAEEYEMYRNAFELASSGSQVKTLLLHADDILFFGL